MDAIGTLLVLGGVLGVLAIVFWPDAGLWWRVAGLLRARERARVEDALKHLYDCEYKARTATVESLAGALAITSARASELAARLEDLRLARSAERGLELTPDGRGDALRVIRVHRLWEQYLAEQTGVPPRDWHDEADRREHTLSSDEVERLAARLGHPRYDPHGDPIPTPDGDIEPARGRPLSSAVEGQTVVVVHVEDEPAAIYAQLVAQRIVPGLRLHVVEADGDRIRLDARGEDIVLAPVVAANLTVVPVEAEPKENVSTDRLSELDPGECADVLRLSRECRGAQMRRLLYLGFVPG